MKSILEKICFHVTWPLVFFILEAGMSTGVNAETTEVRFAYQDRIGSAIPIIAVKKGLSSKEGIVVRPMRFNSGPACAEALYSGAADIGCMGDTTAIILVTRSSRFAIAASHATGEHRHRVMVKSDSRIRSIQDLRGKRIGVKKGTSTYGGLLAAFKEKGMSEADVVIIDLPPSTMTDALQAGSLDAFAASEPTPSAAEQKGARELTTLGGLGNKYPIFVLVNRNFLKKNMNSVKSLLRAMKNAEFFITKHPKKTMTIMASETGLPLSIVQKAMSQHTYQLTLNSKIRSSLEQTASFLKQQNIIKDVPDFISVIETGLIY